MSIDRTSSTFRRRLRKSDALDDLDNSTLNPYIDFKKDELDDGKIVQLEDADRPETLAPGKQRQTIQKIKFIIITLFNLYCQYVLFDMILHIYKYVFDCFCIRLMVPFCYSS
jgi:hypothetical protein